LGAKNGIFDVLPARKMGREPKMKYGGGGGEGRTHLQTNPWILKTSVRWRQRTELVIGWAFLSSPPASFVPFSRCNSLLPNPTETLATQASPAVTK